MYLPDQEDLRSASEGDGEPGSVVQSRHHPGTPVNREAMMNVRLVIVW